MSLAIGVDLGGTKIEVVALDEGGGERFHRRRPTPPADYEGVLATIASVVYLHRLDAIDGRRDRRFVPRSWKRLAPVDGVVIAVLGFWHLVGANTSDDGYLLTMARSAGPSGYMANYFRWLGSPESPVGWYYEIGRGMPAPDLVRAYMWYTLSAIGGDPDAAISLEEVVKKMTQDEIDKAHVLVADYKVWMYPFR